MRSLLIAMMTLALARHADAGEFIARDPKVAPAAAPAPAVARPRAKQVRRVTHNAAQTKKAKKPKKQVWTKRPMP